jgi:predicted small metal-binding protein
MMTKTLKCRDLGFDCDAVVTAETEDDVLQQVAAHGKAVHDVPDEQLADPAFIDSVRSMIEDDART